MKILFITPTYYPHIGGVEYVVKSIAERIAKKGHDINVLTGEPQIEKPSEEWLNNVRIIRWPTYAPSNAYHIPRLRRKLEEHLKEYVKNTDVVHIHSVHSVLPVYCGLKLSELGFKGKLVVTPHFHETGHSFLRKILWIPWRMNVRKLLNYAIVHSVSKFENDLLTKHFGVSSVIIEHGVEETVLKSIWKPENFVMYSGRIERYKNIDRLVRIVTILNKRYDYDISIRIYGEGSYKEKLKKVLETQNIKYELGSFKPYEEYIDILSRALFFGLFSQKEAYGQGVNEANAIGVPVVVAKPWGINFKDRNRTLIVDLSDRNENIAKKIALFIEEAPKQSKTKVPSWNEVIDQYLFMYRMQDLTNEQLRLKGTI